MDLEKIWMSKIEMSARTIISEEEVFTNLQVCVLC